MLTSNEALFRQVHPTKNTLDPRLLKLKSSKKLWWICEKGHEWEAIIANRNNGSGCSYCTGRKIGIDNSVAAKYPQIAAEWHPTKNEKGAQDFLPGANTKVWWRCSVNTEHEWETSPNCRCLKGTGCPHCTGRTTFGGNTVADRYPEVAAEWHPTRNGSLTPKEVCPSSDKKVWWICPNKHEYESKCSNRTIRSTGCPYCASKKVSKENNLKDVFPRVAAEWHPTKNDKKPEEYTSSSGKKVWWQCSKNNRHEWQTTIVNRTDKNTGCPVCSGRVADDTSNLLLSHPEVAAEWHPTKNGDLVPTKVTRGNSSLKVWWKCKKNPKHEWQAKISNRTVVGTGCPYCCMSHMERKVTEYFEANNISFETQKKFNGLGQLSYDFYLPEQIVLIECDGRQHFEEAPDYFHHQKSLLHQRKRDIQKNAFALKKHIPLFRIAFTDEKYIPSILEAFLKRVEKGYVDIVFSSPLLYKRFPLTTKMEIPVSPTAAAAAPPNDTEWAE